MPNIVLTTYCNLHCPYCFADTMITEEQIKNIDINQFTKILNWCLNTSIKTNQHIGLIGGEPLLHPQILDILDITHKLCKEHNTSFIVFTNGIYLDKIINYAPNNMNLLININTPTAMTIEQWDRLNANLNKINQLGWLIGDHYIKQKATLGCNICQEINDYSFYKKIIENYSPSVIRLSVTAPTKDKRFMNKEDYYNSLKDKFLSFISWANTYSIKISFDCNQIPYCYFTQNELALIHRVSISSKPILCKPVIDITPDFYASSCFGAYDTVDCSQFKTVEALTNYFLYKKMVPLTLNNNQGKCANCHEHLTLNCQGGCLAFSLINNIKDKDRHEIF